MRRHMLGVGARVGQQPGRPLVPQRPVGARQVPIDRRADERVHEPQRHGDVEHLGTRQLRHTNRGLLNVNDGERGDP